MADMTAPAQEERPPIDQYECEHAMVDEHWRCVVCGILITKAISAIRKRLIQRGYWK